MLVYPVSLIQAKNQTDQTGQSSQSTLLYRKHGSCYLYYSLLVDSPSPNTPQLPAFVAEVATKAE